MFFSQTNSPLQCHRARFRFGKFTLNYICKIQEHPDIGLMAGSCGTGIVD